MCALSLSHQESRVAYATTCYHMLACCSAYASQHMLAHVSICWQMLPDASKYEGVGYT